MIQEIWLPIKDYESHYEISNMGRIRSIGRIILRSNKKGILPKKGIILKQKINAEGYCIILLYKNTKRKKFFLHRLVANAFILNPDNKPYINHKNAVKTDNKVDNLEWCTPMENSTHYYRSVNPLHNFNKEYFQTTLCKSISKIITF